MSRSKSDLFHSLDLLNGLENKLCLQKEKLVCKKNNFQYWLDGAMRNDDENANYIKNTIVSNISQFYLQINNFEDYEEDMDLFLKNQEYILNMSSVKYKTKLIKEILKLIDL